MYSRAVEPKSKADEKKFAEAITKVIAEKHAALRQPRQLARFLCGITSPAAARERLSRHDHFGMLAEVPFQTVLTQAESLAL